MNINLEKIKKESFDDLDKVKNIKELEEFKIKYLGRKRGKLTLILKALKSMPQDQKREIGFLANELKNELVVLISRKKEQIKKEENSILNIDLTKPHKKVNVARLHPLTKIERQIRNIFLSLNFSSVDGPEIESEFNNFDALNIPKNHPAREMWDTLWLNLPKQNREKLLLRTHTSPMQIRYMMSHEPPFQIIVPGRVFRNEATDSSHEVNFYQVEGLMVGENVSLANFMYIMSEFFKKLFKKDVKIRYRPSYFPFVEPGLEIDIQIGKSKKWLEVAGAGMVHPNVFRNVGYNPNKISGFAFGFGMDRLAMIKYGINDIRILYSGDLRFIKQPFK